MKKLLLLAILAGFSVIGTRKAQAVFMYYTPAPQPTYVYVKPTPTPFKQYVPAPIIFPNTPIYVPHSYSTYVPTHTGSVEGASTIVEKKKIVWPPISKEDKKAPDFIVNKTVPMVVDRIFNEVFGRKPDKDESGYWKVRARHDKATETKLRKTMQYISSKGWTYCVDY